MCLLVFALHHHPAFPLIIAANRDEFYARPTTHAAYWKDHPQVFAGRDLEKGGTWLGVTATGRFAALTNFRDPASRKSNAKSRGQLVSGYLTGKLDTEEFLIDVEREADKFEGFNLIAGNPQGLHHFSSRDGGPRKLNPGVYGVSNHLLDTPWPKLMQAKAQFERIISKPHPVTAELFELLADRSPAPDDQLPDTGVGLEWERTLSPIFVASPGYGTRASTVVMFHADGKIAFDERSFGEKQQLLTHVTETIQSPRF